MRQYISKGDFLDIYTRILQRGNLSLLSKIFLSPQERTRSTFDHQFEISIWTMVPEVKARLNQMASGDVSINYEQHFIDSWLKGKSDLKLLSIGCGTASHEQFLAANGPFKLVHGIDLGPQLIATAQQQAKQKGLDNTSFEVKNFFTESFTEKYDVLMFHQSLHHFADFDFILGDFARKILKPEGLLLLNEYGGPTRFQWPAHQLKACNKALHDIPMRYRQIFKTSLYKTQVHRPGWWRMKLSDPSESLNSESLRPKVNQYFETLEEKPLGGNLVHLVLKDIAHNFVDASAQGKQSLTTLFENENGYLKRHPSDFFYGVYRLKD